MQTVIRCAALAIALCILSIDGVQAQTREDGAAIHLAIEKMATAFNTKDDQATVSLATPDADFVLITGRWSKGVAAYVASRRPRYGTVLKNASVRIVDVKIRFLRPDVALAHVLHEISGMSDAAGNEVPIHPEFSLRVYVKERGQWLMTAFHNTAVAGPPTRRDR